MSGLGGNLKELPADWCPEGAEAGRTRRVGSRRTSSGPVKENQPYITAGTVPFLRSILARYLITVSVWPSAATASPPPISSVV